MGAKGLLRTVGKPLFSMRQPVCPRETQPERRRPSAPTFSRSTSEIKAFRVALPMSTGEIKVPRVGWTAWQVGRKAPRVDLLGLKLSIKAPRVDLLGLKLTIKAPRIGWPAWKVSIKAPRVGWPAWKFPIKAPRDQCAALELQHPDAGLAVLATAPRRSLGRCDSEVAVVLGQGQGDGAEGLA